MTMQYEGMFEAPAVHEDEVYENPYIQEAYPYGNPYAQEMNPYGNPYATHEHNEFEWEMPEASFYGAPEAYPDSQEWEVHEGYPYGMPEAHPYSQEWEIHEAAHYGPPEALPYGNPYATTEFEDEFEDEGQPYGEMEDFASPEWEDEGEFSFKKAFRLAKRLAPLAAKALAGGVPGVGAIAGPLAAQLTSQIVSEGEMEAMEAEATFFGGASGEAEVGHSESAHEAALTEMLAAEAAEAATEGEAEALLASALPITITIMGGRRALRRVIPALVQANGRLVQTLGRQGPAGRQLLRTVPAIQRRAIGNLRAAARTGQPINSPMAVRAMSAATHNVLNNPAMVQRAMQRNAMLRRRVAPYSPRHMGGYYPGRMAPYNPRRMAM